MYLPQFHSFPENDRWWGRGYTEWTAVKRARPLYRGHIQPKAPEDGVYYDLKSEAVATFTRQAGLMRRYGVYAAAFYQYYFEGKMLMEKPMEILRDNPRIDMNYCICWANESWTRAWYDLKEEVLMEQRYGGRDQWHRHFEYCLSFFKDRRYIKVDGRPVFMIYRTFDIEALEEMAGCFNRWAVEEGFPGIFFIGGNTAGELDGRCSLMDGWYDFEPGYTLKHHLGPVKHFEYNAGTLARHAWNLLPVNSGEGRKILERRIPVEWIYDSIAGRDYPENEYPGIITEWDNTPRRSWKGLVYTGASPALFEKTLRRLREKVEGRKTDFVFLNAWNEWGEGAMIEPTAHNGRAYLEALLRVTGDRTAAGTKTAAGTADTETGRGTVTETVTGAETTETKTAAGAETEDTETAAGGETATGNAAGRADTGPAQVPVKTPVQAQTQIQPRSWKAPEQLQARVQPRVSVITIIYHVEPFLEECLKSLAAQKGEGLEFILVVGHDREGNDFGCARICRRFARADARFRIVTCEATGASDARNLGLGLARGRYIGWVDGDDYVEAGMFSTLYRAAQKTGADVTVCGRYREYPDHRETDAPGRASVMGGRGAARELLGGNRFFFHCWDKLFKREVFENRRFPEGAYLEDRYTIGDILLEADKVVYIPRPLYHFRVRSDSMSTISRMCELNTEADEVFCAKAERKFPELARLCESRLLYSHITCVQNALLDGSCRGGKGGEPSGEIAREGEKKKEEKGKKEKEWKKEKEKEKGRDKEKDETKGKKKEKEYDLKLRHHLDYIRVHLSDAFSNPKTGSSVRLKAVMALYAPQLLKALTVLHTRKVKNAKKFSIQK